ncbi:MAG: branched-chain amino acid ABC transporter permease [Actinomycetota bacterium]|nr:branched-chain amino acid ABC transporter permease [Actinomycetota bacterium]
MEVVLAFEKTLFIQLLVNGLTLGSLYALIALGYSMVYGILKLLNFAHGDVYMVGAFVGYGVLLAFGGPLSLDIALAPLIVLMFLAAMLGSGALGVVIERFAYRPLREAPRIAPLISALGVSFFLQNSVLLLLGAQFRSYEAFQLGSANPELFEPGPLVDPVFVVAGVNVQLIQIIVLVVTVLLMIALTFLVARTQIGKAMRATAFDREAAAMMGIDVDRVIASTFFIGSVLAGAAGVMFGLLFSQVFHFMGFLAGLKGFTAAVVGGIGSIPGAMLGGLLVGLAEAYAAGYLGGRWSDLTVFAILIFVLLVRPSGLLGTRAIHKV